MSDRDEATPTPETELLHWGREEEFDNPTGLFEVGFEGDLRYWVSAEDAADALLLVKTDGEDDHLMGETIVSGYVAEVKSLSLDEANSLTFFGDGLQAGTIAAEYNRDPSPRVIACSEWAP